MYAQDLVDTDLVVALVVVSRSARRDLHSRLEVVRVVTRSLDVVSAGPVLSVEPY